MSAISIDDYPKVQDGYKRQWVRCKTCGSAYYRDYVPYSLSNPILTLPCNHTKFTGYFYDSVDIITEEQARGIIEGAEYEI